MYGMPYGYGYGSGIGGSIAWVGVLTLIGFGAIIALSIFCYIKFMGKDGDKKATIGKFKIGEFFDMNKLYLEKFIKVLFMISAVAIAVFCVLTPFLMWAAMGSFLGFIIGIFVGAISLVIWEVLNRLGFEYFFMFVRMAGDTHAMRNKIDDGLEVKIKD